MDIFKGADFNEFSEYQEFIEHYGVSRRDGAVYGSGRYPLGSGDNPYQHSLDFISRYDSLRREGYKQTEIAEIMGTGTYDKDGNFKPSTKKLRAQIAKANDDRRKFELDRIHDLLNEGMNYTQIAKEMGFNNESSVRSRLDAEKRGRINAAMNTADFLKDQVDSKGIIDIGKGVEKSKDLGVSREKLDVALDILKDQGYEVYTVNAEQLTNRDKYTKVQLLCPPGTEYNDLYETRVKSDGSTYRALRFADIHSLEDYISYDDGKTFKPSFVYPSSMDSKRIKIRYAEEGGIDKDGLIEIRRGVDDLSLGESSYAQVRILVDNSHFMKGMAVYSDNMPDGVDVVFNTNKKEGTPMLGPKGNTVLKNIDTKNPDNPFGSLIKEHGGQSYYIDKDGKEKLSLINKRAEEGDWNDWSDVLPAQFLSKQNPALAKKQLDLAIKEKELELKEIEANTNPAVKKKLLNDFAGECDTASVHLEAAAMPRQKYQVILPLKSIKDDEVFAPNYHDGEKVALIRFPHGGTFEIPILTVNNHNEEGIDIVTKTAKDAVGINKHVADRLSGADFDGDTVMVIPVNERNRITSTHPLKGLEGFDPSFYSIKGNRKIKINTEMEMGKISNLITDMTIAGATEDDLSRAVRHSMVVIDAEKHNYDWKKSEIDNKIDQLKKKYQLQPDGSVGGVSTLISKAKSPVRVEKRQGNPHIDINGDVYYNTADENKLHYTTGTVDINGKRTKVNINVDKDGRTYYSTKNADGSSKRNYIDISDVKNLKVNTRTQESTKMAEAKDARSLISVYNSKIENVYADYANSMKDLARKARLSLISTPNQKVNQEAKKEYKEDIDKLTAELYIAESNKPKERKAQLIANNNYKAIEDANPNMTPAEKKKIKQQELTKARIKVGKKRYEIKITDRQWDAILAGAVSDSKLSRILLYADPDDWKARTTPKKYTTLSDSKVAKLHSLSNSGVYSIAEIADILGVSTTTVRKYMKGE